MVLPRMAKFSLTKESRICQESQALREPPMNVLILAFLFFVCASIARSDDFKTLNGKEYKNAAVTRVEPDGIVVKTKSGISKLYFTELPKDVQERFAYNPQKAADYSAQQGAASEQARRQQDESLRQEAEEKNRVLAERRAALESARRQQEAMEALQLRYQELQRQEDELLLRIGEARRPASWQALGRHRQKVPNPTASQLPYLESHLKDVRREKDQIRKRLDKTQR